MTWLWYLSMTWLLDLNTILDYHTWQFLNYVTWLWHLTVNLDYDLTMILHPPTPLKIHDNHHTKASIKIITHYQLQLLTKSEEEEDEVSSHCFSASISLRRISVWYFLIFMLNWCARTWKLRALGMNERDADEKTLFLFSLYQMKLFRVERERERGVFTKFLSAQAYHITTTVILNKFDHQNIYIIFISK